MTTPEFPSSTSVRKCAADGLRAAFSLVEVTLAMGISSFALLVIFSMLPAGLASMQDSGRQIAETEIFNRIGSELTSTAFYSDAPVIASGAPILVTDILDQTMNSQSAAGTKRFPAYFDNEGNEVAAGSPSKVFTVQCTLSTPSSDVWVPYNSNNGSNKVWDNNTFELRYARVLIGYQQDPLTDDNATKNARKRVFLLANRGQ